MVLFEKARAPSVRLLRAMPISWNSAPHGAPGPEIPPSLAARLRPFPQRPGLVLKTTILRASEHGKDTFDNAFNLGEEITMELLEGNGNAAAERLPDHGAPRHGRGHRSHARPLVFAAALSSRPGRSPPAASTLDCSAL